MTGRDWTRTIIILIASLIYWAIFAWWGDVSEPWDAHAYWTVAYPISVIFAGAVGWHMRAHAWAIGVMTSLTQLPIMAAHNGATTNWAMALAFLIPLSIPHGAVAYVASYFRRRRPQ